MKHCRTLFAVAVVGAVCLICTVVHRPDPTGWPSCPAFRCRECGGPASVDPHCSEHWGCRSCEYTTYRLCAYFRPAYTRDIPSGADYFAALEAAGGYNCDGEYDGSPAQAWALSLR